MSIGKNSNAGAIPFIDEKLSNINDTMQSNKKDNWARQNQSINALASVFERIDPTKNLEETIGQINESKLSEQDDIEIEYSG